MTGGGVFAFCQDQRVPDYVNFTRNTYFLMDWRIKSSYVHLHKLFKTFYSNLSFFTQTKERV
uniref:Uncharacterized protein n=1 Tax=Strongyloides papillosus TaxID=174720 RepID=A0A0N5BYE2_STREA